MKNAPFISHYNYTHEVAVSQESEEELNVGLLKMRCPGEVCSNTSNCSLFHMNRKNIPQYKYFQVLSLQLHCSKR
jgi:hypothetical protein